VPGQPDEEKESTAQEAGAADLGRVAVLGAGRMGLPIIGHLVRRGYPTTVYDPGPQKRSAVQELGARFTGDLAEAADGCSAVLVCVGYEEQLVDLMTGKRPLPRYLKPGTTIAVLSTVSPERIVSLSQQAAHDGVHLIDATVCRGGEAADKGELLTFVGGPADVVERITPVLRAYSSDVVHTGDAGTAQVAKAVNNLILWACLVADHEGLALASRYGVDVDALRQALLGSSAANTALANWGRQTMAWAEDDMKIVADMAVHTGLSLPQAALNREVCRVLKPRRYRLEDYGR
jgi:3-hydroxyisobutyrate dehydrogenase-like beta-hydroxyacid dehydrogenase